MTDFITEWIPDPAALHETIPPVGAYDSKKELEAKIEYITTTLHALKGRLEHLLVAREIETNEEVLEKLEAEQKNVSQILASYTSAINLFGHVLANREKELGQGDQELKVGLLKRRLWEAFSSDEKMHCYVSNPKVVVNIYNDKTGEILFDNNKLAKIFLAFNSKEIKFECISGQYQGWPGVVLRLIGNLDAVMEAKS